MSSYTISANAVAHTEDEEGFRTEAYQDDGGQWTIGFGTSFFPDGRAVKAGDIITKADAFTALTEGMQQRLDIVVKRINVILNQNQVDAIADFAYNVGTANFIGSHFLLYLNQGNYSLAADQLLLWVHDHAGNIEPGLVKRRDYDRRLFLTPMSSPTPSYTVPAPFADGLAGAPDNV